MWPLQERPQHTWLLSKHHKHVCAGLVYRCGGGVPISTRVLGVSMCVTYGHTHVAMRQRTWLCVRVCAATHVHTRVHGCAGVLPGPLLMSVYTCTGDPWGRHWRQQCVPCCCPTLDTHPSPTSCPESGSPVLGVGGQACIQEEGVPSSIAAAEGATSTPQLSFSPGLLVPSTHAHTCT